MKANRTARIRGRAGTIIVTLAVLGLAFAAMSPDSTQLPAPNPLPGVSAPLHPVHIRPGPEQPRLDTGMRDSTGGPVFASCGTCHSTLKPNTGRRSSDALGPPHQGLRYSHGSVSCLSCHHAENYDFLRLADGRPVAFSDTMMLCGQCHGPQKRDYDHGSHGGMTGHWDLQKGPRLRNHCVHCHDPHHPEFPLVKPVLPPRDRLSVKPSPSSSSTTEP
jgi:hypothetical protein